MDAGGVGACGGFGQAESAEDFAGGQAAEIARLLFVAAEGKERSLDGGTGDRDRGGHGGMDLRHLFEHEDVGDRVEPGAAPFFRKQHAAAPERAEFLYRLARKVLGAFPVFDVRVDFGLHEFADGVADQKVMVGEGEIHGEMLARVARKIGHGEHGDSKTDREDSKNEESGTVKANPSPPSQTEGGAPADPRPTFTKRTWAPDTWLSKLYRSIQKAKLRRDLRFQARTTPSAARTGFRLRAHVRRYGAKPKGQIGPTAYSAEARRKQGAEKTKTSFAILGWTPF